MMKTIMNMVIIGIYIVLTISIVAAIIKYTIFLWGL